MSLFKIASNIFYYDQDEFYKNILGMFIKIVTSSGTLAYSSGPSTKDEKTEGYRYERNV